MGFYYHLIEVLHLFAVFKLKTASSVEFRSKLRPNQAVLKDEILYLYHFHCYEIHIKMHYQIRFSRINYQADSLVLGRKFYF